MYFVLERRPLFDVLFYLYILTQYQSILIYEHIQFC
jgi:hypothetical protein